MVFDEQVHIAASEALLNSKEPPPDDVQGVVGSAISAAEVEISQLDTQNAPLRSRQRVLTSFVNTHRPIVFGFRRLPFEIIGDILQFCLPKQPNDWVDILRTLEAPWSLSYVSRKWRDAVLSTPSLWARFRIQMFLRNRLPCNPLALLETALERSNGQGLDVCLDVGGLPPPFSDELISTILHHRHRLEKLCLIMPPSLFSLFNNAANLDRLHFLQIFQRNEWANDVHLHAFQHAPRLRTVHLRNLLPPSPHSLLLPLSQISHLYIEGVPIQTVAEVLPLCTHLLSLCLGPYVELRISLTFSYLSKLHLPSISIPWCSNMHFPVVEELHVDRAQPSTISHLVEMASKMPSLTKLELHLLGSTPSSFSDLANLFVACNQLSSLSLYITRGMEEQPETNDNVIMAIGRHLTQTNHIALPGLQFLSIRGEVPKNYTSYSLDTQFLQMAEVRRSHPSIRTLTTVHLNFIVNPVEDIEDIPLEADRYSRWMALRREGLDISLNWVSRGKY